MIICMISVVVFRKKKILDGTSVQLLGTVINEHYIIIVKNETWVNIFFLYNCIYF